MRALLAVIGLWEAVAALHAQDLGTNSKLYQVLGPPISDFTVLDEGFGNRVMRGKPFSSVEERHSLQILRDGTHIETSQKNRLFRDGQGRTRVEQMNGGATIEDVVAGFRAELDPSSRTAVKGAPRFIRTLPNPGTSKGVMSETTENLKPQLVNGVMAQGVRTTMTIPKGQIGNDRDIKVVTERWVSNDLQMLIKSSNSDPRFGDTTYELTAIDQHEPDASLFQIPANYTVMELDGGRGGRSPLFGGRSGAKSGRSPLPQQ